MSDSRTSVDGSHSLRLVSPAPGGSFSGGPYPSALNNGTNYSFSVHAKAATEGIVLDLRPSGALSVKGKTQFNLTTEWARYELIGVATTNTKQTVSSYTLTTAGTAWLDMLDVHQLNDCPANDDNSAGFSGLTLPPFDNLLPTAKALNKNSSGCCEAGWIVGVDFQQLCEARSGNGWFWFYPDTGPYLCCKAA
jgi:hypothetical protein